MEINQVISVKDRGLNYGDGFFTTAKVVEGNIELKQLHHNRLRECQQRLFFPHIDLERIWQFCEQHIKNQKLAVLKILITRGSGGRGYLAPQAPDVRVFVQTSEFPTHYEQWRQEGVKLEQSNIPLGHQPLLAGLKTLNRLEQVLIKQDMRTRHCHDVLVRDISDNVIETSMGNLIYAQNDQLFSPSLEQCGIKGVFLESLSAFNSIKFKKTSYQDILSADAVFICNSLMGLVPVSFLDENEYNTQITQHYLHKIILSK